MRHALTALLIILCPVAKGDDWPQWFGPKRDGIWRETGLLTTFPKEGPIIKWRTPIHAGYSGPAVSNRRVYLTDFELKPDVGRPKNPFQRLTQPGTERVVCLDESTGNSSFTGRSGQGQR